ncbi:MAG: helix-turn-helix domain-containing protein [Sphaerochaetaceae bacterium]
MTYQQPLLYEQGMAITINHPQDPLYYYFDYDERQFSANMEFQHFHEFYEIFILLEESASHLIEGQFYDLKKYDMVLLRPSLLHKTKYLLGPPSKRLIINFSIPTDLYGMTRNLEGILAPFYEEIPIYRFPQDVQDQLFGNLNQIFSVFSSKRPNASIYIHAKFMEFLFTLNDQKKKNCYEGAQFSDSITQKIYSITSHIHANYREPFSLDGLSKRFFISPCYLSHQFKEVTGFTLIRYIQMTRVKNAQQLLLYTDLKIKEITERCGFSSFSQFNRVFNKFCGCSPSQFRIQDSHQTLHLHIEKEHV